jgi:hypothetical protein
MAHDGAGTARSASITWTWSTETKAWLVEAHSLRDGSERLIASCVVFRSDPLPDYLVQSFLSAIVDYWASLSSS